MVNTDLALIVQLNVYHALTALMLLYQDLNQTEQMPQFRYTVISPNEVNPQLAWFL